MTAAEEYGSPSDERHLAALLLSPSGRVYLDQTLAAVDPDDFEDPTYGWMWAAARVIHERGEPISRRTLTRFRDVVAPAKQVGEAHAQRGTVIPGMPWNAPTAGALAARISQVMGEPIYAMRLPASIRTVTESGRLRRLVQSLDRARAAVLASPDYSSAAEQVHDVLDGMGTAGPHPEVLRFDELAEEFLRTQAAGFQPGEVIPTPWHEVNQPLSGGLHRGRMTVLAGRPGAGKTNLGLAMAAFAAENGYPALIVSQEMSALELTGRAVASGARIEYSEIVRRNMSATADSAARDYLHRCAGIPLWMLDKTGIPIEYVIAVTRSMRRSHDLALVVIDYGQLLDATDSRVSREQQVSHISRKTKLMARETGCAAVLLSQLNRSNAKDNREPDIHDLRESGSLEQDSDLVMLMHHDRTSDGHPTGMVKIILGKSRFGPTGTVELRWHGHQARVGD